MKKNRISECIIFLALAQFSAVSGVIRQKKIAKESADYQLSMDLLEDYPAGFNVLPTANPHDVVNVSLQMALYHIMDMNERAQTLTTNCEIITKWHDVFLMWDPEDYDGILDTRLPWDKVWTPDIVLYNAAGDGEQGREMRTLIQVDYQGNVTLLTQSIYMSKCTIDVTYYPFDAQKCELKFASWTTEVTRINMSIGSLNKREILGLYSPSGVYELKRIWAERHEQKDPCCTDSFADVTYYLLIWRRPQFFLFNYIQPAVLINILALFVFLIPPESGEKITLGISTMLNMTVFLMTVTSGIPPTDQTPILSVYYATVMVLTTAATVLGVIVLRIHHQGRRGMPVPPYLRKTAQFVAVIVFYKYPPVDKMLENLNNGLYSPGTAPSKYVYNIKDQLADSGRTKSRRHLSFKPFGAKKHKKEVNKCENSASKTITNGGPAKKLSKDLFKINNQRHINDNSTPLSDVDSESKTEDEETPLKKPTVNLWKKAATKTVVETKEKTGVGAGADPWKDLSSLMMEERYKAEERKEILGEEWRKISRIFDRFLLAVFTVMSLITTFWCIFTSPHFPDPGYEDLFADNDPSASV